MRDQEIVGLWEAYNGIYEQESATGPRLTDAYDKPPYSDSPKSKATRKGPKMKGVIRQEEVEIAAEYFYEMGLNEDGVDILIEDLGVEEFAEFVYDISENYYLTEARAGGTKIEPKLASGKAIQGKPKAASLKRLRAQKAARQESENKTSESKPSGLKASLQRQSAVSAAAKKQPKKPGVLDRIAGAVKGGIEAAQTRAAADVQRRKKFMNAARETGKTISKAAGKIGGVAKEVGKGASGAAKIAGHVASKGLEEETDLFDYLLEYLVAEGYADTNDAAISIMANMSEEWRESIVEEVLDEKKYGPNDELPSGSTPRKKAERKRGYHGATYMLRRREPGVGRNDQAADSHLSRGHTIDTVIKSMDAGEEPHKDPKWKNTIAARRRPRGQGEVPNERPGGLRANRTRAGGYRTLKRKEG
jgi:hypothetical protein